MTLLPRDVRPLPAAPAGRRLRRSGGAWPRLLKSAGLTAALGAVTAVWLPRGPVTTGQALTLLATSALVGTAAGWLLRSRWAMLLAPLTYVLVFELLRLGTDGPLVDRVVLTSPYGVVAFVLGRGLHGLLALAPMLLGAAVGAGIARRTAGAVPSRGAGLLARRSGTLLCGVALVVLAAAFARPASTAPILASDGSKLTGSVAELTRLDVGDHELGLMLRGSNVEDPVLLFLPGGPGGSERGGMRRHGQLLEQDFVVATLDQRGSGTSYDQLDPVETLTLEQSVDEVVEVARQLSRRFDQDQIILVGQSWGTIPAVLAAERHPELFRAYVGIGQMVDPLATDTVFYDDTLAWARRTGNDSAADKLVASGPPPYDNVLDYEAVLSNEAAVYPYDHSDNAEGVGGFSENLLVREYTLLQQAHALAAFMDTFTVLYPQLQDLDFRTEVTALDVPVFLAQGRHEAPGRAGPAEQWFANLDAPLKDRSTFGSSGHRPMFEQPAEFHRFMVDVRDRT